LTRNIGFSSINYNTFFLLDIYTHFIFEKSLDMHIIRTKIYTSCWCLSFESFPKEERIGRGEEET
jgi:hypothetical protein